ncbi:MAG TPA: HipA domain-containing protein, partial [Euzebya sp.]|nr:HipA domain-containing protein [Euzebya sp.]
DPVGDVQIVPDGEPPDRPAPKLSADRWADVRFDDLLHDEGIDPVALAGVQPKASAAMLALPIATAGGHHLLKLAPPEFPHLVENEAFFLQVARRSGLRVADAEVVQDKEGRTGLLVTRFDRHVRDGHVGALAQEDGGQVMGRYPADKYTVTTEEVTAALIAVTRARPVAARELVARVAFAYLTGNGDLHAKNLSVGQTSEGEWRVTPAYDLPSSQPYGDTTMALTVQGRKREDITRTTILQLAEAVGLRSRAAASTIDTLIDAVDGWLPGLESLPFDERRIHRLRRVIIDRRAKLRPAGRST